MALFDADMLLEIAITPNGATVAIIRTAAIVVIIVIVVIGDSKWFKDINSPNKRH